MTTAQLLELWHEHPSQSHLRKLATWQLPDDEDIRTREFRDSVTRLQLQWLALRISRMEKGYAQLSTEERRELLALQQDSERLKGTLE